jgi:hypothetical protein
MAHDEFNVDNYPLGTNAVVAVISYTVNSATLEYISFIIFYVNFISLSSYAFESCTVWINL